MVNLNFIMEYYTLQALLILIFLQHSLHNGMDIIHRAQIPKCTVFVLFCLYMFLLMKLFMKNTRLLILLHIVALSVDWHEKVVY